MTRLERWNKKLAELYANRDPKFRRTPKDKALEERLAIELECIYSEMTKEERDSVKESLPEPPRYRTSIIAQDEYGRLYGFEVDEDGNDI